MPLRWSVCPSLSNAPCVGIALAGLLLSTAAADQAPAESMIISRYLSGPIAPLQEAAVAAAAAAGSTLPPLLANPEVGIRREDANGTAGAATEAVGGALTVELGFASLSARSAAQIRSQRVDHLRREQTLTAICTVRQDILSLWDTNRRVLITTATLARLEEVLLALSERAAAGESSGYDRDRVQLAMATHRLSAASAQGAYAAQQAWLASQLGSQDPVAVQLSPLPPLAPLSDHLAHSQQHPRLAALQLAAEAAAQDRITARRSAAPDLHLAGGVRWDAPPDGGAAAQGHELSAALELPLFDLERSARQDATAREAAAAADLESARAAARAGVEGAWERASALESLPLLTWQDGERIWGAARARHQAGEGSIDELLRVAEELGSARLATAESQLRYRTARLELSCAAGHFDTPEIQAVFEDTLP